jgi:SAM-dependent methyltransferase
LRRAVGDQRASQYLDMARLVDKMIVAVSRARGFIGAHVVDRRKGIETSRVITLDMLGLPTEDRIGYAPSGWRNLPSALRHIPVGEDDVFLDLGSGKGRIVLQAAAGPFKRVVGVEISAELNAISRANLEATRSRLRCQDVELIEADISTFRIPDDVTVVYAYNPVRGELFETAMQALLASYDRNPRQMHLLYRYPREHDRLDASGRFHLLKTLTTWRPRPSWRRATAINVYRISEAERAQIAA